ncbi:MAG TPA: S1C family serine protease [Anaerolineales bacterium]|nr:S1C family serine protease [Anaerolineales bacterium]
MNRIIFKPLIVLALFILLVGLACQAVSSATQVAVQTEAPVVTTEPLVTEAPQETQAVAPETEAPQAPAGAAVSTLQDVRDAVIQIEAQGTFVDPEAGLLLNAAGRGSGFIIDPSGIAVTNNHVVTGSALLKVFVAGNPEPLNARVLGVSECSDLAVIDIEGDGFAYLDWFDGDIAVGTDMYVAGFPLGDPEYTLNKGIISKARADGETSWSSVESVIEYDATTNPGNSGGPVITADGKVLGVHYASLASARQAFGISRDIAKDVIDILRTGENVDTIGVNGEAVILGEENPITGIWVSSTASGSPADRAGVEPGDIILELENLILATDGSMAEYCDVLRSHEPTDTLSLRVLRPATLEVLEGQLNGRELEVAMILDGGEETGTTDDSGGTSSGQFNPNASASGDVVYSTDFDDVDGWLYFLISGDDNGFTQEVTDGKFRTEITDQNTYVYYIWDEGPIFEGVRLDFRVENLGSNTNWVGAVCNYSDDLGWYEITIQSNGEYQIQLFENGVGYRPIFTGGSRRINMGRDVNEYTVICNNDAITVGINGVEERTETVKKSGMPVLRSGQVGLTVSSLGIVPVIVEFDNFIVSIP